MNDTPSNEDDEFIVPDRSRLPAGAAEIRDRFNQDQRKKIKQATKLDVSRATVSLNEFNGVSPQDVNLAIIVAGLEKNNSGEVAITNFLATVHVQFPQLSKTFLKNLRKAVQSILKADSRAAGRGNKSNVVNENDHLDVCKYAIVELEEYHSVRPEMFRFETEIAEIKVNPKNGMARISVLDEKTFKARLERTVVFRKSVGEGDSYIGVSAPQTVSDFVYREDLDLPLLEGVARTPVFSVDGQLIQTKGYHERSRLFYSPPPDLKIDSLPRDITDADLSEAIEAFTDILGDFEMDGVSRSDLENAVLHGNGKVPASFLNAIGWMLEQIVRPMIAGPVMPLLVSKTAPGAGGGLLVQVMQTIVEGRSSPRPMARSEDERRKAIFAALSSGAGAICWDNLPPIELDSPTLAMLFTEPTWTDRVLTRSVEREFPVRCSFSMVGNRPPFSDELRRRLALIELIPQVAEPEKRTGFKFPDLLGHVQKNRGKYVRALLVLAQHWIDRGQQEPIHAPIIGRYECYRHVVGGIIEAASPEFISWQANKHRLDEIASDEEEEEILNLLEAWYREGQTGDSSIMTADAICGLAAFNKIVLSDVRKKPNADEFDYAVKSMGSYLGTFQDRFFTMDDGVVVSVVKHRKRASSGNQWMLKANETTSSVRSSKTPDTPSQQVKHENKVVELPVPKRRENALTKAAVNSVPGANPFA